MTRLKCSLEFTVKNSFNFGAFLIIDISSSDFESNILSGFFSGSETGMMAANKIKLRNLSKKSKTSAKRALDLLKRPDQLLSAILVGNNFANILASAIVTIMMLNYFGGNVVLGSIILTIVILIFSEITPKTMAAIKPESFATRSSFILNILVYIFKPLIFLTNFLSKQILKIFNLDAKDATLNENLNTEELRTLLEESGDLIPKQYRKMLSSVLGMEELIVEDIMIPASEIIGIDVNMDYQNATKIIQSTEYTRLPVYKDSIDNMIGVLHLKDSHAFLKKFNEQKDINKLLQTTSSFIVLQYLPVNHTIIIQFKIFFSLIKRGCACQYKTVQHRYEIKMDPWWE